MTFKHQLIRSAFNQTNLTAAQLAFRLDMSVDTLDRLLDGHDDPGDIRVATLVGLAEALGLPLQALFAAPEQPPPDSQAHGDLARDAAEVIATIYDRGSTPTLNTDLCTALQWDLDRLHAAFKAADQRLRPAGLALKRAHGETAIVPLHDTTAQRKRLNEADADSKGLHWSHYKTVYALLQGQPWENAASPTPGRRRFIAGQLLNLGILTGKRHDPSVASAVIYGDPTIEREEPGNDIRHPGRRAPTSKDSLNFTAYAS